MDLFDLTGEVAAVIGGTGVLGGALAEGLARAGASVAILGRNADRGLARANLISTRGGVSRFFPADALNKESLDQAHAAVREAYGDPVILVNAAGGTDPKVTVTAEHPFESIKIEDWHEN